MKSFLCALLFSFVFSAQGAVVDGTIVYKKKNDELVKRDVSLEIPSQGRGEVVLSGKNFEWRTRDFWSLSLRGETKFFALFKNEFMGKKSTLVFKGTYLKGSNKIMYYGSFYKRKGHHAYDSSEKLKRFSYSGGFKFEFDRD